MDIFSGFCIRKKNQEVSVEQKHGVSGLISHIAWVNISSKPCKAKLFVNFSRKLYQKYVKYDALKHRHHFPSFFLEQIQNVSKKVIFKKFGLFFLFAWPSSFRKRFPFIKKAGYNVEAHETLISRWCFYLKPFRSYAYSCKTSENQKNGASFCPKL